MQRFTTIGPLETRAKCLDELLVGDESVQYAVPNLREATSRCATLRARIFSSLISQTTPLIDEAVTPL
jgi:hypothetical protein